jgi:hypothetical protein
LCLNFFFWCLEQNNIRSVVWIHNFISDFLLCHLIKVSILLQVLHNSRLRVSSIYNRLLFCFTIYKAESSIVILKVNYKSFLQNWEFIRDWSNDSHNWASECRSKEISIWLKYFREDRKEMRQVTQKLINIFCYIWVFFPCLEMWYPEMD